MKKSEDQILRDMERGKRLKAVLESHFGNINKASKALGIKHGTIQPYLTGKKGIGPGMLETLQSGGISPKELSMIMFGDIEGRANKIEAVVGNNTQSIIGFNFNDTEINQNSDSDSIEKIQLFIDILQNKIHSLKAKQLRGKNGSNTRGEK